MPNQKGFSLIELLIVVAMVGIIAAIAIPNFMIARLSANEGSAVSSLRTFHSAQMTYQVTIGAGNYAGATSLNTTAFNALANANLIDSVLGSGTKSGYTFTGICVASGIEPAQFGGRATPTIISGVSKTGIHDFAILTQGIIYSAVANGITVSGGTDVTQTGGTVINN